MPGVGVRCRMRIGIVYDLIRWEERALAEAAERLGHEVRLIQVTRDPLWLGYGNGLGASTSSSSGVSATIGPWPLP